MHRDSDTGSTGGDRVAQYPESTDADLATALGAVGTLLQRYVRFASFDQVVAVTLWVALTHVAEHFDAVPYLAVTSAEKRSGKSRLFDVLELLVRKPWRVIQPSEAVVYRKIAKDRPTLLLDEADAIFGPKAREHEGLRALLNAGNRRGTTVPRCGGKDSRRLEEFEVFCPKALAAIGDLPDTVADRSIPIRLQRRAPGESVERFRRREAETEGEPLRIELERWADTDETAALGAGRPPLPDALNDRAADAWEPLFVLAQYAGGSWLAWASRAAVALNGASDGNDEESAGVQVLADLRDMFLPKDENPIERLSSARIVADLAKLEDRPWPEWRDGKPITPRQLARLLKPYGIRPSRNALLIGGEQVRGYELASFRDAFRRYLPSRTAETRISPSIRQSYDVKITYDDYSRQPLTDGNPCKSWPTNEFDELTAESREEATEGFEEGFC